VSEERDCVCLGWDGGEDGASRCRETTIRRIAGAGVLPVAFVAA
jgi:hypothetical protein